jgi:chromosome condensin MukBEF ATPase and DNA-binding subunit MukB
MSEDKSEELALAEEVRARNAEIEQLQKEKEEAAKLLAEFQEREKADLVGRAFELEVQASISKSEDEKVRKTELSAMSAEVLRVKIEDLKRVVEQMAKFEPAPKSQAVVVGTEEEEPQKPLTYRREVIKAGLREALGGMVTSERAKKVVMRDAMSTQNPNHPAYRQLVKENIAKLGRNE